MFEELYVVLYFFFGLIGLGVIIGLFICAEMAIEELGKWFSKKEGDDGSI